MSSFESIIGDALLGGDKAKALSRVACKTAAMQLISCPSCKRILDQKTTVVVDGKKSGKTLGAWCRSCWDKQTATLPADLLATVDVHTWDGLL